MNLEKIFYFTNTYEHLKKKLDFDIGVIGGGFLRDTILDNAVRDIDLYVTERFIDLGIPWKNEEDYMNGMHISNVAEISVEGVDYPVNVIKCNQYMITARSVANSFNFGLCMVTMDDDGLFVHKGFLRDVADKTLTCYQPSDHSRPWAVELCQKHYEKLQNKYPDYKLIDKFKIGLVNQDDLWE